MRLLPEKSFTIHHYLNLTVATEPLNVIVVGIELVGAAGSKTRQVPVASTLAGGSALLDQGVRCEHQLAATGHCSALRSEGVGTAGCLPLSVE